MNIIEAVIFDLGGVLVDFRGGESIENLTAGKYKRADVVRFWNENEFAINFTKGTCSNEDFLKEAINSFKLRLSIDQVLEFYKTWYHGLYDGAQDILENLNGKFKIGCLSNTNFIDVPRLRSDIDFDKYFDSVIFSCEVKMAKPEHEIYHYAAHDIGCEAENILFIDDNLQNVQAAIECGMRAVQAYKLENVKEALNSFGLIQMYCFQKFALL